MICHEKRKEFKMSEFKRSLNDDTLNKLKNDEPLFKKCLLPDIRSGEVFPAIRKDYIDFYYAGRRLFGYDKDGFKTHIKYASVLKTKNPYIRENEIATCK